MMIDDISGGDLPRLSELYGQLSGKALDHAVMTATFEKIAASGDYYLFGARADDDSLIGTVMAVACHDLATGGRPFMVMENLVVDSGWHRQGVGTMLVRRVESIARARNCIFVQFCSSGFRTGAHAFYRSSGYDPDEVKGFRKFL